MPSVPTPAPETVIAAPAQRVLPRIINARPVAQEKIVAPPQQVPNGDRIIIAEPAHGNGAPGCAPACEPRKCVNFDFLKLWVCAELVP